MALHELHNRHLLYVEVESYDHPVQSGMTVFYLVHQIKGTCPVAAVHLSTFLDWAILRAT